MILDSSYFKGKIPVSVSPSSNLKGDEAILDRLIKKYEPSVLTSLLGYELYSELMAHISDTSGKYFDLLKGKKYWKNGKKYKWNGLIYEIDGEKFSLLADYIYYEFLLYKQKHLSHIGMITNEPKNAKRVNSTSEIVNAYNDFVNGVVLSQNGEVGLYQFISDMDTYNVEYTSLEYKNHLGL